MAQDAKLMQFAEVLRAHKGVESRSAILGTERVDIIRGKDFARWFRSRADEVSFSASKGKSVEDRLLEIASTLLRRGLLVRCERRFKKPPPGQDRLIKFPKKVVMVEGPEAQRFSEDDFYAWTYERPTSPLVYVFSALAAMGVILVCLFPVAPSWFKAGVVYFLAALLSLILLTLALRAAIAAASYIGTGRTVWVLPNALADDKPLSELFTPLVAVDEPTVSGTKARVVHYVTRIGLALVLGGLTYVLYTHSPGKDTVRRNAFKYRDEIFDMLNVHNDPKLLTKGEGISANTTTSTKDATGPAEPEPASTEGEQTKEL